MTHHLAHVLMLVLPLVVGAGVLGVQWRVTSDEPLPAVLWVAVATTASAGVVHGGVTGHHLHEDPLLGWAMALMAVGQLTWAVALLFTPVRRVIVAGVLGNLGIVVLWFWTRAVGVPFGVAGGQRQRVGALDVSCTLVEVAAVLCCLVWIWQRSTGNLGRPLSALLEVWTPRRSWSSSSPTTAPVCSASPSR